MKGNVNVLFPLSNSGGGGGAGGVHYMGTVASASALPASPNVGDLYIASAAFTLSGEAIEAKDMLLWNGTSWDVVQGNIQDPVYQLYIGTWKSGQLYCYVEKNGEPAPNETFDVVAWMTNSSENPNQQISSIGSTTTDSTGRFGIPKSYIQRYLDGDYDLISISLQVGGVVVCGASISKGRKASSVADGDGGFVTGDQVYDYVQTQVGDIETLLAAI